VSLNDGANSRISALRPIDRSPSGSPRSRHRYGWPRTFGGTLWERSGPRAGTSRRLGRTSGLQPAGAQRPTRLLCAGGRKGDALLCKPNTRASIRPALIWWSPRCMISWTGPMSYPLSAAPSGSTHPQLRRRRRDGRISHTPPGRALFLPWEEIPGRTD
jgi:hypothetical protein